MKYIIHIGYLQKVILIDLIQGSCRQSDHLQDTVAIYVSQVFQAHLIDFFKAVALFVFPIDVLNIIKLLSSLFRCAGIVDNAQGHVRLHGQQTAVQIGEGQDFIARQEVPVVDVQRIFLKFSHLVFLITVFLVKPP